MSFEQIYYFRLELQIERRSPVIETFEGLVYVKHGRIGIKSEGPDYYLQTWNKEYLLKYADRGPWELDYYLDFFCRKFVEVTGELNKGNTIKVTTVKEICVGHIPQKDESQLTAKKE